MLLLTMFWWIRPLQKAKEILQVLLLVFPPYALSGGFLNLAQNQIFSDLFKDYLDEDSGYKNPYDQEVIGNNLLALALESLLFLLLNFVIEIVYDQDLPSDKEA